MISGIQRVPEVAGGAADVDQEARESVGTTGQALEVGRGDSRFDARVPMGPGGRLLEIAQAQVPSTEQKTGPGPAEERLGELWVSMQLQGPVVQGPVMESPSREEGRRLAAVDVPISRAL